MYMVAYRQMDETYDSVVDISQFFSHLLVIQTPVTYLNIQSSSIFLDINNFFRQLFFRQQLIIQKLVIYLDISYLNIQAFCFLGINYFFRYQLVFQTSISYLDIKQLFRHQLVIQISVFLGISQLFRYYDADTYLIIQTSVSFLDISIFLDINQLFRQAISLTIKSYVHFCENWI